jgi:hypothetical protein
MSYTPPSITASGTTFAQFQAGGASGHLEKLIATQPLVPTAAPTAAPTLAASGSGNTLAANTYYVVITETNGYGETTASPVSSSQVVSSGQKLTVTFPPLKTGNTARNVYLGLAGAGPFTLYATGITTATFDCTVAAPNNSYAVHPPKVSTSGLTYADANGNTHKKALELLRGAKDGNLEDAYRSLRGVIEEFNSGQPSPFGSVVENLRHAHVVFAALSALCSEMGTLIDANAGTLHTATTGIGGQKIVRTWP